MEDNFTGIVAFQAANGAKCKEWKKHDKYVITGIKRIRMGGTMKDVKPIGWTPESVLELGRREWFESMMNAMPREELFKMRGAAAILKKGEKKGEKKGKQKGEAKLLTRLLTQRFGKLPATVCEKIASAHSDTLERWGDLLLDARSIEDVFGSGLLGTRRGPKDARQ